jgi:hypothetical protein
MNLRNRYVSDHVDNFWDGANDVSWCSPIHATNGSRHEFRLHPGSTRPKSDAKTTIHEPTPANSYPSELISSYKSNESTERCEPDAKQSPQGGKQPLPSPRWANTSGAIII